MKIGATLPQLEIGEDPANLVSYTQKVESAGYDHLLTYDHVLGVNPSWDDWEGPYDNADTFHEPLTTLSYLAAHTDDLGFATGILILPQRQTALVAKQAAQVDLFADGRFRMGVGVGWNPYEYRALGEDFSKRGRRVEEQIDVMRRLWTEEAVEFEGEFHELPDVGINPRPVQQPIPLWIGGMADPVKHRIARIGDGWIPQFDPDEDGEDHLSDLYDHCEEVGRDPDEIGIQGRMSAEPGSHDDWIEQATAWDDLGADYLSVNTMYQDQKGPDEHGELLEDVAETLSEAGLF